MGGRQGTALLRWADDFCRSRGASFISLEAMASNPAIRLYERHGYEESAPRGDCCGVLCEAVVVWLCFGCRYCGTRSFEKAL